MFDLIVRNAVIPDQLSRQTDIACENGKIIQLAPNIEGSATEEIDAKGQLVAPPFVDSHFHLDSTLSYGKPVVNQSGTLLEGINIWRDLKAEQRQEEIVERALRLCTWSIARGVLAIRSHVDVSWPGTQIIEALLEVKRRMSAYIDIQLVAFPQDGFLRDPQAEQLLVRALDMGVDVVGGIPHFERSMTEGAKSVRALCEIAEKRALLVDMHCDETDDPLSRHIETLTFETQRLGMQGRVTGSHLTSMHSMDNYYVSKLLPLMAEAQIFAVSNPLINITLQGRHDSYPKRRGLTRIKEMWDAGIPVALGHDCVLDPWYPLGSHDMLEVASMGIHAAMLTAPKQMNRVFEAITTVGAQAMHLEGYGLKKGCNADFTVLQATCPIEAIRLRATRLFVVRRGKIIARSQEARTMIELDGESSEVNFKIPSSTNETS